jgi:serine/threonine protein kinase
MSSAKQCSKVCAGCAGNILLDGSGTVKVADFGLSRLQAATCGEPLTAELGTWQWMAPEVVAPWDKRGAVYTEKADVYSFGIVMWECAAREVSNLISVML